MLARARRRLFQAAAVVAFLVLVGATYQGVATALERHEFVHPGQLADVGGHQLHLYCTGDGAPTVVLEAPAAAMSAAWGWVQPALAEITRVCSYDRAGLGWSEAGDAPFDPAAVPEQLRALLVRTNTHGPYVIAGQGFGAALARLDAERLAPDVAALVLIDPPDPTMERDRRAAARLLAISPWLARTGLLRATGLLSARAAGLPEPAAGALATFLNRPDHLARSARELGRWNEVIAEAHAASIPAGVAVIEVEAAGPAPLAFLTTRETADAATRAIERAVRHAARQR